MSTKQNVAFASPAALIAPDLAVEQQQIERKQALIDALRQQAMQPIDGGRGKIAWTQGFAKLADALVARKLQRENDKRSIAMNRGYAQRMAGMFGLPTGPQPVQPPMNASPQQAAPQQVAPQAAPLSSPQVPADPMLQQFDQTFAQPETPLQQPMQEAAPQQAPMQELPQAGYSMSLSGNPQQDFNDYLVNPDEYTKAMIASHAPVDMARTVQQAQQALARGDVATANALLGNIQKQNYIAPENVRSNSVVLDPITKKPLFYNPNVPIGAAPAWDANGHVTGISMVPGATQSIAQSAGAKTAGENANEPISGFDAQGNPVFGSKLDAAHGGNPNFRPGAPLGAVAAADVQGKASAEAYNSIASNAASAPDRIYSLKQIGSLVNDPKTILGPGSASVNRVSGVFGTLGQKFGLSAPQSVTNAGEANKWFAQYGARQAEALGLNGSDSRFQVAMHASPNGEMTPQALRNILPTFIGWEVAAKDRGLMAAKYQQTYGLQSAQNFQTAWSQAYDPRVYTWMAEGGVQSVARHVKSLPAAERRHLLGKYDAMKALGATFNE